MVHAASASAAFPTAPIPCGTRVVDRTSAAGRRMAAAIVVAWLAIGTAVAGDAPVVPESEAVALLARIQQAAQRQNYVGTFVHQQGSQVQSSRVMHVVDRTGEHEKLELMDGQQREFIRHNDDVRCYMADSQVVLVEKRARSDSFPALLVSPPVDFDRYYQLSLDGDERVAGRAAQRVVLRARDQQRYGYRLWFDKESFLLLKAQTIGEKGASIEQVAFTDIAIGGVVDVARIRPTSAGTERWRTETNRLVPVDLTRAGWSVAAPVPGFRKVMEVRRAFGGRDDIGQMVWSDGFAAISIFIEPAEPHDAPAGESSKGPINVVTQRHGEFWLTIVGDAPVTSIREMAKQIDFKSH